MEAGTADTLDVQQIMAVLPHRYPFLMVDRIESIVGDESCVGIKNVTMNEPFFQGHFPGRPVMPGVLLVEGMAQSAGVICATALGRDKPARTVYLVTVDKAKFRRPVVPGDRVEFHMHKINQRRSIWWYRGKAMVDGNIVCEAEISAMIGEP